MIREACLRYPAPIESYRLFTDHLYAECYGRGESCNWRVANSFRPDPNLGDLLEADAVVNLDRSLTTIGVTVAIFVRADKYIDAQPRDLVG